MSTATTEIATVQQRRSLVALMADKFHIEAGKFIEAVKATCIKGQITDAQFAAFLMTANQYDLNPLLKEIFAFPANGGIQPIVSIDGWFKIANRHPQMNGIELEYQDDAEGNVLSVTAKIYRKDRQFPIIVTEYLDECKRNTEPWNKWPRRMLRHKAAIQGFRMAFGFSGIVDEDEGERILEVEHQELPATTGKTRSAALADQIKARSAPPAPEPAQEPAQDAQAPENEQEAPSSPQNEAEEAPAGVLVVKPLIAGSRIKIALAAAGFVLELGSGNWSAPWTQERWDFIDDQRAKKNLELVG